MHAYTHVDAHVCTHVRSHAKTCACRLILPKCNAYAHVDASVDARVYISCAYPYILFLELHGDERVDLWHRRRHLIPWLHRAELHRP